MSTSPSASRTICPIGVSSGMVAVSGGGGHAARPFTSGESRCGRGGHRPQVGHGVAAPWAPVLGQRVQVRRVVREAERHRRPPDAEVGRHEGIGVAQRPHGHVLRRPGADARERDQGAAQLGRVGPGVDHARPRGRPPRPAPPRRAAGPPAWRRRPGRARPARRARPGVGKRWVTAPTGAGRSSPAASTSRPATVRAPGTETCCPMTARTASSKPSAAPGTRRPGSLPHQRADERVVAQGLPNGDGIGVEVEQLAAAGHRRVQVAQVRQDELALHVGGAVGRPRLPARAA